MARVLDRRDRTAQARTAEAPPPAPHAESNQALARLLQRDVGWRGAGKGTANAEQQRVESADAKNSVERIPIDGSWSSSTTLPSFGHASRRVL